MDLLWDIAREWHSRRWEKSRLRLLVSGLKQDIDRYSFLWIAYAFSLGLGFVSLQTLSYYGYVKVDHVAIKKDFQNMLDLNEDGKIDGEDGKIAKTKILEVLQFNMPAGGGFVAGFVGGLRSG